MNAQLETVVVGPYRGVHFGWIIREAWEASGLTQQEFAERLGVSQPRIVEIFGTASISEQLLDRCVAALGCELEVRIVRERKQVEP
jgi:plasmid maintenance system antidote protein VapI